MADFVLTVARGLEALAAEELHGFGVQSPSQAVAAVHFEADAETAARVGLGSRLGSRLLARVARFAADDVEGLYAGALEIPWEDVFDVDSTFAVAFTGRLEGVEHPHYGALRVKDAIVDRFRDRKGGRPEVDGEDPDCSIHVHAGRRVSVSVEVVRGGLHRRGYRELDGGAPLRETLAAAMTLVAGWGHGGSRLLLDPMCGAGTILLEAALRSAAIAPGLLRGGAPRATPWIPQDAWATAWARARDNLRAPEAEFVGFDDDDRALEAAQHNALRLAAKVEGFDGDVARALAESLHWELQPLRAETSWPAASHVITNPPYGHRLGSRAQVLTAHRQLGRRWAELASASLTVIGTDPSVLERCGGTAKQVVRTHNGGLAVELHRRVDPSPPRAPDPAFANRLRKNLRKLKAWRRKEVHACFRVYDADIPEFNVAVDRYGDWAVVQEYAAPKEIEAEAAAARLDDALEAVAEVLEVDLARVVLKTRARQRGAEQYHRAEQASERVVVEEAGLRYYVNFHDYLDVGLFLDHRPMRRRLRAEARGCHVLNLFAYTGSATVAAVAGGATSTTTVDLSRTYLDWARDNLELNGLMRAAHKTIQADCIEFLRGEATRRYDLIFLDPPTFSNSKRMRDTFDVQRDHAELIRNAMRHLVPGGRLYFSCNRRRFELDAGLGGTEITDETIDPDFARRRPHRAWVFNAPRRHGRR